MAVFRQVRDGLRKEVFEYLQGSAQTSIEFQLDVGEPQ